MSYAAVDDAGVVLDHTIVEAQLVGGLAQGIGQALMETAIYDEGNGQLVTGTFMDYAMPRARTCRRSRTRATTCRQPPIRSA